MPDAGENIPADSDENKKERRRLYEKFRDENTELRQKSFEQFDKAVLTFSSGGLGLSISFIKDIVPLEFLTHSLLLFISWFCFVIAILSTLYSFKTAPKGIDESIKAAEDYYLKYEDDAFNRTGVFVKTTRLLNSISWWALVIGVVLTVIFTIVNLTEYKEALMLKKTGGYEPSKMQKVKLNDGAEPTKMQKAPGTRGAEPSPMQAAPKPATNQGGSNNTGNSSNQPK